MTQHLVLLRSGEDKDQELLNLFRNKFDRRDLVLVFVARKNTCDFVANMLNRIGVRAAPMHSDRSQDYREKTLAGFKEGSTPVMVATDVASRGKSTFSKHFHSQSSQRRDIESDCRFGCEGSQCSGKL